MHKVCSFVRLEKWIGWLCCYDYDVEKKGICFTSTKYARTYLCLFLQNSAIWLSTSDTPLALTRIQPSGKVSPLNHKMGMQAIVTKSVKYALFPRKSLHQNLWNILCSLPHYERLQVFKWKSTAIPLWIYLYCTSWCCEIRCILSSHGISLPINFIF